MSKKVGAPLAAIVLVCSPLLGCSADDTASPTTSAATGTGGSGGTTGSASAATTSVGSGGAAATTTAGSAGSGGASTTTSTTGAAGSASGGASGSGGSGGAAGSGVDGSTTDVSPDGSAPGDAGSDASAAFDRAAMIAIAKKVAQNQIAENPPATAPNDWINAAFYAGLSAAARATNDASMHDAERAWSVAHNWQMATRVPPDPTNADDQICTQTYSDLYLEAPSTANAFMFQSIKTAVDGMIANPKTGRVVWWWCDALFMAPGAFVRLAADTGQTKYFDFMNQLYWDSKAFLFEPTKNLFNRDATYFGKNIFWSRGNGWVLAGIARILDYLPANDARRNDYVQRMTTLAGAIAPLQGTDGLWRADLLAPTRFPAGEASGSGFFVFGMAWGIHHGVLPRDTYLPVVRKGWNGLTTLVAADGRMQWVQPTGKEPAATLQTDHLPFGAGAFLLAASEVLAL